MKSTSAILFKSLVVILTTVIFSCETERLLFEGPYFVRFTEATAVQKESYSQPIKIEVHQAGPALTKEVTINYTISGSAREGIDYTINGTKGQVKIKKGEFFGYIELQLIDNANNILRSQDVIFTLETISDGTMQVGQGKSAIGKSFTFTIQDDCILGGNYYGLRTATSVPVEDITITSSDCTEYLLSNWDIDIFTFAETRDLTFIDNADNTLTIPEQEEETLPKDQATIRGTGIVDPLTRRITMTLTLVDFDNQPQVTFTLVPN
jgi:hypothetical protein